MTNSTQTTDIVVLGSGLTGLTTAYYLQKLNKNFIVLEKQNRIGGVIQSSKENGFLYENGPNTGVVGNTTVVELFEELEKSGKGIAELGGKNVNKRFILKNAKWECMPLGLKDAIMTPLFTLKDKLRILGEPFRPAGKNPHESLASFVKRRMGKSFLDYAIDPFISGVYAGDPNYLIPKYALPKLYNLEQKYGSLIGGTVKKGLREKKTEAEKKVSRKTFSFVDGLGSLTKGLYESAGTDNFILGAENVEVQHSENGYAISYRNESGETVCIQAKNVISTLGAYTLEKTLPFINKNEMSKIDSLIYTKVIEVAVGFDKWDGKKLDGFGGLIPSKEKRDILGVLYMSSLFENRTSENGALISVFLGGVRRQDLMLLNDECVRKVVEKELKDLMKLKDFKPDLFKIMRHNWAIPQYGLESGERFATIEKLEKEYPGLQIGGNLRGGIGMADRIKQGKEMAQKVV
ncbi:MAG: protoporphyrinogen oxidase [Paludibacter sp.]|nr:protoporphyrinogen oxidase [Paludibacter sp.]